MYNRLIEFINNSPLINKSALARAMYPDMKSSKRVLHAKLSNGMLGRKRERFTNRDFDRLEEVLSEFTREANTHIKFNDRQSYFDNDLIL